MLAIALAGTACERDDEATVSAPGESIAVGAYYPLSVSDACQGGGKISFCTTEEVVSIDEITLSNPRVANVLRMEELTEALRVPGSELVVDAKSPGQTSIDLATTFDDGSKRSVETSIQVAQANRMELVHGCSVTDPQDRELFPAQAEVSFSLKLYRNQSLLLGEYMSALVAGSGVSRLSGGLRDNTYRWTSPADAGITTLSSPVLNGFSHTFRTYAPTQLAIDSITPLYDLAKQLSYQGMIVLEAKLTVGGQRPCELPPLQLESRTPEICSGPAGAASWSEEPEWNLSVRALKTGTCQLLVSVSGTETTYSVGFDLMVEPAPPVYVDPCQDVVCSTQVTECPAGNELVAKNCCNECAPVPDAALCEGERTAWDQLYQTNLAGATSCTFDADCGSTVLVGGCRRYCHVLMNVQQISPFMTAVAESYYTKCPHCVVENPAPCGARAPVLCDSGQCRFAP